MLVNIPLTIGFQTFWKHDLQSFRFCLVTLPRKTVYSERADGPNLLASGVPQTTGISDNPAGGVMNVSIETARISMWRNGIMQIQKNKTIRHGGRSSKMTMEEMQRPEIVYEGKLICARTGTQFTATLTADSFLWKSTSFKLEDIIAVSCIDDSCQLLIHTYTMLRTRWVPALFGLARRRHCCFKFLVQNAEILAEWKTALVEQGCHVNSVPVLAGAKGSTSNVIDSVADIRRNSQQRKFLLVILNPCSGHGHAHKIYYDKVEPVFKLAGFRCEVIETTAIHHAQALISSFNSSAYPDGIVCIGGDGIINEVLNGLLSKEDEKIRSIPIGIIPAGSDNSLIWSVFGIKDPITAALAIVNGHLVSIDVLAVTCKKNDAIYLGHTTFYYGFMSDVLELSSKYQRFGPLRYFIAGAIKMFNLRGYECEIQYLPATGQTISCLNHDSASKGMIKEAILHRHELPKKGHWKSKKGVFLGVILCNHQCKTMQCLKTQKLAPSAKHNDGLLDLLLVHKIGFFQLLRFLILMQYGQHISLPFVEYLKVHSISLNSIDNSMSYGIDGELLKLNGPTVISIYPYRLLLRGHKID